MNTKTIIVEAEAIVVKEDREIKYIKCAKDHIDCKNNSSGECIMSRGHGGNHVRSSCHKRWR